MHLPPQNPLLLSMALNGHSVIDSWSKLCVDFALMIINNSEIRPFLQLSWDQILDMLKQVVC